ncbi:FAD-binding oxidoreductase [Pelagibacterium halotolerans]|uniref:D-2-hydroxyglutarate dehydrogenase n=1 Tax=Pelagibacterium halotolerans (strain DSM 22347 / JCM 15775 / CGMCC 1.7692 / B2) TaxID=1082931 RepID=G4RBW0_PELHB|nr:FAD-binding oxidoreductase [Pelagibacterium halotolerans]AEQ50623.1 D-2-hydroxyglutarate dehydrogenase [Pelagibacterium halotolerans B2]QJR19438.1 FAD-binding oxidoreductase [Pelagibacterium halotolerans]SDZ91334.1 4-phosphoerythronate dehydrogenase (FAD-dependent) [Pelagibacterium halotolerans]
MPLSKDQIVPALVQLLGETGVVSEVGDMAGYVSEPRHRFHKQAQAVALPRTVAEVQAVMEWANEVGVHIIPQAGNTGLVGGQVPLFEDEVILSISRLKGVRNVDAAAGHMTLDAGTTLQEAHDIAEDAGMMFPLYIASQGSARIGGVLGSNAGGVQVLSYGNARELCLGVEAVMADGSIYKGLNALRKDNTGYDLKDLLVGSEGTLGIITAATLKLFPKPDAHETALLNVASPEAALELFAMMRARAGNTLTAFELMPRIGIDFQLKHGMMAQDPTAEMSDWYVLVEISVPKGGAAGGLSQAVESAFEAGLVSNGVIAETLSQREALWNAREQMSEVQSREGASIKHDVSVPVAAVPELIARGSEAAQKAVPGIRPVPFGHLGDGNIHFNFSQPEGADGMAFMDGADAVHDAVYAVVRDLGGSVSAEHGIGQLKTGLLKQVKDPVALKMMKAIKSALDPKGILNPGKVLG